MIEPHVRGDPESPLRWTSKSVRNITDFLQEKGYIVSYKTVASILHDLEYSLQGNRKTKEGKNHPDRDEQFKFINKYNLLASNNLIPKTVINFCFYKFIYILFVFTKRCLSGLAKKNYLLSCFSCRQHGLFGK